VTVREVVAKMVQAVILWSVLVGCLIAGLLAALRLRRALAAQAGPNDLGGVREPRAEPVPDVPTAGARLTPAEPLPAPVHYAPEPVPVPAAARSRMNNSGARFSGRSAGRAGSRSPAMPIRP
jgi:hypothetical protein